MLICSASVVESVMLLFNDSAPSLRPARRQRAPQGKNLRASQALAPSPRTMRHVALLIESSGAYGRGLLQGIARYNRERGGWSTYFRPQGLGDAPPSWLETWKGDGILARSVSPEIVQLTQRNGVPLVNL